MNFIDRVTDYFSGKTPKLSPLDAVGLGILLCSYALNYLVVSALHKVKSLFAKPS